MSIRNSYELGSAVGGFLGGIVGGAIGAVAGAAYDALDDIDLITEDISRGGAMSEREYHLRKAARELEKARECAAAENYGYCEVESHRTIPGGYMHTRQTIRW